MVLAMHSPPLADAAARRSHAGIQIGDNTEYHVPEFPPPGTTGSSFCPYLPCPT